MNLSGFETLPPRFRSRQEDLITRLVDAHVRARYTALTPTLSRLRRGRGRRGRRSVFARYGASSEQIAFRDHELEDFSRLTDVAEKTRRFDVCVRKVFERFYPARARAPEGIVHVTCTGYVAPSGAQRVVSARGWGGSTRVLHAYHMGCLAAFPAIQMASGLLTSSQQTQSGVDVVHTELCSLHLDPTADDPAQWVVQSLFADGFIRYRVSETPERPSLEILASHEEILPDSTEAMRWEIGAQAFRMGLSKNVPRQFAAALPAFCKSLFARARLAWSKEESKAIFAIHPGGPRILDLSQESLGVDAAQLSWSRTVLRNQGNMSSATLPFIWNAILRDPSVPHGALVASIGAGPGLTLAGMLFRVHKGTRP